MRAASVVTAIRPSELDLIVSCRVIEGMVPDSMALPGFLPNAQDLGDRKCLGKLRKSFVGYPDAILFLIISRPGVFEATGVYTHNPVTSSDGRSPPSSLSFD